MIAPRPSCSECESEDPGVLDFLFGTRGDRHSLSFDGPFRVAPLVMSFPLQIEQIGS